MFQLIIVFYMVCHIETGSCLEEMNIALRSKDGVCSTSSQGSKPCNVLIDGKHSASNADEKWSVVKEIVGEWFYFTFNTYYEIRKIVVYYPYNADQRNINQTRLLFKDGSSFLFNMPNRNEGRDQHDTVNIEPSVVSNDMNMTVTEPFMTGRQYTALLEVEVYGILHTTMTMQMSTDSTPATSEVTTFESKTSTTVEKSSTASIAHDTSTRTTITSPISPSTTTTSSSTQTPTTITTSTRTRTSTTSTLSTTTTATLTSPTTQVNDYTSISSSGSLKSLSSTHPNFIDTTTAETGSNKETDSSSADPPVGIIVGVVMAILVVTVVLLVVILIILRRRRRENVNDQPDGGNVYVNMKKIERDHRFEQEIKTQQPPVIDPTTADKISTTSSVTSSESSVQDLKLVDDEPEYANTQPLPVNSNAIKLADLIYTVDDMLQKPMIFQEEFKSIPAGKQHATTFADRSTLQPKNRFKNIKPYDHSRVSLVQKESVDSVYINANFISAFKRPKYYIAAQGPNNDTVTDFWRMIWEQRVSVIVMVTNCIEGGKDKCRQYWPDGKKGAQQFSGDFEVVLDKKNKLMADYTVRDFRISQNDESRNVRQYHYTSWPDEGVPTSCSALISFVNRIREYTDDKEPPIVVHCSAGVGRTGTFIVVNYSIDMASEEGIVDIKKVVHRLREDRINMVQTLSQYKFLYALMLECLYCGEVTIPCQGASEKIQQIFIKEDGMDSPAEKQWIVLEVLKPKKYDEECLAGKDNDNIEKNRTQTILPHDNHRPYLRRRPDYTSNYINAVFVDGYKQKNKFLLTQHPLENTIVDLWRTVSDFNVSTIVMLNGCEDNADAYWPEDEFSEALQYGDFLEVTFKRVDKQVDFTITELDLSEDKEKANVVTHIHVKNWSEDSKPKLSILPALYNTVSQAQMTDEDSRIMIHSLNGGGNTGVYCALHQIFDKIKEEQEIDIFNAVKNTRMPRPDSIPDLETYKYLHEASVQFIEEFSTYANFR